MACDGHMRPAVIHSMVDIKGHGITDFLTADPSAPAGRAVNTQPRTDDREP